MSLSQLADKRSGDAIEKMIVGAQLGLSVDLVNLAREWHGLPDNLRQHLLLIFLDHLNSSDVPTDINTDTLSSIAAQDEPEFSTPFFAAFWSLLSLIKMSLSDLSLSLYASRLILAWPGIFKWGTFFFASRIQTRPLGSKINNNVDRSTFFVRAMTRDVIAGAWWSLSRYPQIRDMMISTRGLAEVVVGLWDYENDYQLDYSEEEEARAYSGMIQFKGQQSPAMGLLRSLLYDGSLVRDWRFVREILRVNNTEGLAELTVGRLKDTLKAHEVLVEETSSLFELIEQFAHQPEHQISEALMRRGAGKYCTKVIVKIALAIKRIYPRRSILDLEGLLHVGFQCLPVLVNTTTGFPWIIQFVNAGIFSAFVEASLVYDDLNKDFYDKLTKLFSETIPQYLCYRSVLEAVDTMLQSLEKTEQFLAFPENRAWRVFEGLTKLTAIRKALISLEIKGGQRQTICSNNLCQKADALDNFRRCADCLSAFYCSRDCQVTHWKGGHKAQCMESWNSNDETISRREIEYRQHLNLRDARVNSPNLRKLAAKKYPGVPLHDLVVHNDYTTFPSFHQLLLRSELAEKYPELCPELEELTRLDVQIKTLIIASCPYGRTVRRFIHYFPMDIWTMNNGGGSQRKLKLDSTGTRYIDPVEELGLAKWRKYWGLRKKRR